MTHNLVLQNLFKTFLQCRQDIDRRAVFYHILRIFSKLSFCKYFIISHLLKHMAAYIRYFLKYFPKRHGCISDASLRLSTQSLKGISRWLINKSKKRLHWDILKMPPQWRLRHLSDHLRSSYLCCIWDFNSLLSNWRIFWLPVDLVVCL